MLLVLGALVVFDEGSSLVPSSLSGEPSVTGSLVQLPTEAPKTRKHGRWNLGRPGKLNRVFGIGGSPHIITPTPPPVTITGTMVVWSSSSVVVIHVLAVYDDPETVTAEKPVGGMVMEEVIALEVVLTGLPLPDGLDGLEVLLMLGVPGVALLPKALLLDPVTLWLEPLAEVGDMMLLSVADIVPF